MPSRPPNPRAVLGRFVRECLVALVAGAALAGCALPTLESLALRGEIYKPANVYGESGRLPATFKRVAVLPVTSAGSTPTAESGRDLMEQVLVQALIQAGPFEAILIQPGQLRQWTGQAEWRASDRLPANFFERLREATACDGVMFCHLTQYRPYPPQAVGWRLELVDATSPRVLWSVDELFDASNETVSRGAQRYQLAHPADVPSAASAASVLDSPSRFGRYAASTLVGTLPGR
jgi:hypothetical protein